MGITVIVLDTEYLEQVLGKTVSWDVKRGTAMGWELLA
jgi:hypothetical protein